MTINEENFAKAYDLWSSFKEEVLYQNRFIINHGVLDYLKHFAERSQKLIEKDTILYRARQFTGDDSFISYLNRDLNQEEMKTPYHLMMPSYIINSKQKSGFWGFDEKDSYVPPKNDTVNDGRANPAFIKYLYTAEEPYTAIVEARPYLNSRVSVAEIRVNKTLNVADFSYDAIGKLEGIEQIIMYLIMSDFSKPTDSDKKSYIPTQYVTEFIKTLGMEGIKFNSSLHGRGRNITIFNYEKCEAVGSKLYEIEDICYEIKGIAPKNEKDLIHEKLVAYKQKRLNDFLARLVKTKEKKE